MNDWSTISLSPFGSLAYVELYKLIMWVEMKWNELISLPKIETIQ